MRGAAAMVAKMGAAPAVRVKLLQNQAEMLRRGSLTCSYGGVADAFASVLREEGAALWRGNQAKRHPILPANSWSLLRGASHLLHRTPRLPGPSSALPRLYFSRQRVGPLLDGTVNKHIEASGKASAVLVRYGPSPAVLPPTRRRSCVGVTFVAATASCAMADHDRSRGRPRRRNLRGGRLGIRLRGAPATKIEVVSLFPLLQPLVAVLGWDILKGQDSTMQFWTSKSQALRLQEYSHYRQQTYETSCEEYFCDLLCFHLDLACFVSSAKSGHPWNLRNSLLLSHQEQDSVVNAETLDPFVENMILERLAVQTPMRGNTMDGCVLAIRIDQFKALLKEGSVYSFESFIVADTRKK